MRQVAEQRLDEVRDGRLAEEADAQRGERDPELAGRQVAREVVHDLDRGPRAALALLRPRPRACRGASARARTRPRRRTRSAGRARTPRRAGGCSCDAGRAAPRRRAATSREVVVVHQATRTHATRSRSARRILAPVRIVSLVPSATEMLFALGLGDEVTAVTHECDHPPQALELPKVTRDVIGPGLEPAEIDRAVRELTEQGRAIYELDEDGAARPAARPDRHAGAVRGLRGLLRRRQGGRRAARPRAEGDLARPAHARRDARRRARARRGDRRARTRASTSCRTPRPGSTACGSPCAARGRCAVAALEWLDPVFVAGHWTPAADRVRGRHRRARPAGRALRDALVGGGARAARPEVVVVMPCGYDAERALEEAYDFQDELAELGARRDRRRRRRGVLLAPRPAAGRRARAARAHPAPGPRAGAAPAGRSRSRSRARPSRAPRSRSRRARRARSRAQASTGSSGEERRSLSFVDGVAGERAAEQAADVAADRDVEPGEQEREGEVDEDRRAEPRLHRVDAARAQEHDARAHQPEHRARGADGVACSGSTSRIAPNAPDSSEAK